MRPFQNDMFPAELGPGEISDPDYVPDIASYDHIIIATSFGKDSISCHLRLIELGADPDRIEWWHHDVDDSERSGNFITWPFEKAYGTALADHLGVKLRFSAKDGGFLGEMRRENAPTRGVWFETDDGDVMTAGGTSNNLATRLKFPQVAASHTVRWCSSYTKIDVGRAALTNQPRFLANRTLFITGERAEESARRKGYIPFRPHMADRREGRLARHIDHWLPIHNWTERDVWNTIRRHGIVVAIPYYLGFSRFSCAGCIFGSPSHFATLRFIMPEMFASLAAYEKEFGCTIKRNADLHSVADSGEIFPAALENPDLCRAATLPSYDLPVFTRQWRLPAGAYGRSGGPG